MSEPLLDRMWSVAAAEIGLEPRDGLAHPFGLNETTGYWWYAAPDVFEMLGAHQATEQPVVFGIPVERDVTLHQDSFRLGLSPEWDALVELDLHPGRSA